MKPFKFFDHTADILYEATGRTFEGALENAALALFETTADLGKVKAAKAVKIRETAPTLNELATHVLSDLVAERDARGLFFRSFKVTKFSKPQDGFAKAGKEASKAGKEVLAAGNGASAFGKGLATAGNMFVLEGVAKGSPMTQKAGKLDVKAVTHHQTKVTEAKGIWTIRVLLDI